MSHHSKSGKHPVLPLGIGDIEEVKDKSHHSLTAPQVAQVLVFPHDEWEDLDLEGGRAAKPAPSKPTDVETARHRRRMMVAALVGCVIIALALGLGLGLGLKPASKKVYHRKHGPIPALKGAVGPRSPPAGSSVSKVPVSDAAQLQSLLAFKGAVDGTNILKGQWTTSGGANHGYCKWDYVVCDAAGKVIEGINMTTDTYEVVFSGTLPPASALKGLPGLREIDIRLHMIKGELPSDWAELTQLELIRLDQNSINGQLPPSWSKLRRLRMLTLWDNDLEGPIPDSWADLQSLEVLDLSYNNLVGELPEAFAAMGSLRELLMDVNRFSGPLPEVWAGLPNLQKLFLSENSLTGSLPESWADLSRLTDLWVEYNQLSGSLPGSYGKLASLERLSLNDNAFSGTIPKSWGGMESLQKLYLYNNRDLTGCVPTGLQEALSGSLGFDLPDYVEWGTQIVGYCKA